MAHWRAEAIQSPHGSARWRVACLPVSACRRGSCDSCYSRRKRAAKKSASDDPAPIAPGLEFSSDLPPYASKRARLPLLVSTPHPAAVPPCPPCSLSALPAPAAGSSVIRSSVAECPSCASARLDADSARRAEREALAAAAEAVARVRHLEAHLHAKSMLDSPTPNVEVGGMPPLVSPAGQANANSRCQDFMEYLVSGGLGQAQDEPILGRIASVILLRSDQDEICLQHKNGRRRVYVRKVSPQKVAVKKSQQNKRRAAARQQLVSAGATKWGADEMSGTPGSPVEVGGLSVLQQVGLVFELGISWSTFSKLRHALGGSKSGLASRHILRAAKRNLASSPAKEVMVTSTGAHLANLALAVQERVTALCDAGQFVERFVYGPDHEPLRAEDATVPNDFDPGAWGGRPPSTVPDVHITVGLDKGGDPGSEKSVVTIINQERPNNSATLSLQLCARATRTTIRRCQP